VVGAACHIAAAAGEEPEGTDPTPCPPGRTLEKVAEYRKAVAAANPVGRRKNDRSW
jgi:hypothetical protein